MAQSPDVIDIIAAQILLDTKGALEALKNLDQNVKASATRIAMLAKAIQGMANSQKTTIDEIAKKMRDLNASMGGGLFGKLGVSDADINRAAQVAKGVESIGTAAKKTEQPIRNIGSGMENAARRSKYAIDVVRTALGVLTAMLVNIVLSAIVNFARDAVKAFTDVEDSLWRIHVAEKRLSEMGSEVTFKGLQEGARKIKDELKIFSEADILSAMSAIAAGMAKFGISEQQIVDLTKYVAILNVVSAQNEDLQTSVQHLLTTMQSASSRGVQSLNLQFGEQRMQLAGVKMGFLEAGEAASNLTLEEQALVKQEIVKEEALAALREYSIYLETNSAKLKENAAGWEDVKTSFGGFLTAIAPGLNGLLEFLTRVIDAMKFAGSVWVALVDGMIYSITSFAQKVKDTKNVILALLETIANFPKVFKILLNYEIRTFFNGVPGDAPEWFKKLFGKELEPVETPTAPVELPIEAGDADKIQEQADAFEKLSQRLKEIAADAEIAYRELTILTEQKYQDIVIDAQIRIEDIELEFQQKIEDAERELQQAIEDIHIEARQAEADAIRNFHEDQLRAEAEYQQKLKELRERFLMDLEEALHARDARQVLRLIKQYEFEKKQAAEQKALDDKLRRERLQAELEAIRIEEQQKIAAEQREYARKVQQLEIEKQREIEAVKEEEARKLEELKLWNQREAEEIARHAADKMAQLEQAYIDEYGIHGHYQEEIRKLIEGYTQANIAMIDAMYAHMAGVYAGIEQMYTSALAMMNSLSLTPGPPPTSPTAPLQGGYAEGGTVIATQPTRVLFGERGPELATFIPLGRQGRDVNKVFGNIGSAGGGRLLIEMLLSPDLEARVVENSLARTADVIARVSRSK